MCKWCKNLACMTWRASRGNMTELASRRQRSNDCRRLWCNRRRRMLQRRKTSTLIGKQTSRRKSMVISRPSCESASSYTCRRAYGPQTFMSHTMDSLGLMKGFSSPSGCTGDAIEEASPGIDTVRRGSTKRLPEGLEGMYLTKIAIFIVTGQ